MTILGRDLQRRAANTASANDLQYMHAMEEQDKEERRSTAEHSSALAFCHGAEVVGIASHEASFRALRLCTTYSNPPGLFH